MVALSASRLVWLAMSLISFTTSPIFSAASARLRTWPLVRSASATALLAMSADWPTWRLISAIEPDSSSVAAATVCTLLVASSDAAETTVAWRLVCSAVADRAAALACISLVAAADGLQGAC